MKEAGMRIRVEPELREEFTEACKRQHVPAAQVLRNLKRLKSDGSLIQEAAVFILINMLNIKQCV